MVRGGRVAGCLYEVAFVRGSQPSRNVHTNLNGGPMIVNEVPCFSIFIKASMFFHHFVKMFWELLSFSMVLNDLFSICLHSLVF